MSAPDHHRRGPGMSWFEVRVYWDGLAGLVRGFFRLLYRLRAEGADRVPRAGPLIYVANHQSHYDPPLVGCVVHDRPCRFLARRSLFRVKPFAAMIRAFGAIPLDRDGGGPGALRSAIAELAAGRCVLLFPEGTRSRDGSLGRFRPGVLLLVRRTNATVVPVAVDGLHDVWPPGRRLPRLRGRISVRVGAPIPADELLALTQEDALQRLRSTIEELRKGTKGQGD